LYSTSEEHRYKATEHLFTYTGSTVPVGTRTVVHTFTEPNLPKCSVVDPECFCSHPDPCLSYHSRFDYEINNYQEQFFNQKILFGNALSALFRLFSKEAHSNNEKLVISDYCPKRFGSMTSNKLSAVALSYIPYFGLNPNRGLNPNNFFFTLKGRFSCSGRNSFILKA